MSAPQLADKPYISRQALEKENQELKDMVLELFSQGCHHREFTGMKDGVGQYSEWKYDHMCLSTYEFAQRKLIEWGLIKPEDCVREA